MRDYSAKTATVPKASQAARSVTDCVVVAAYDKGALTPAARAVDKAAAGALSAIFAGGARCTKPGQTLLLHHLPGCRAPRVLVAGAGAGAGGALRPSDYTRIAAAVTRAVAASGAQDATVYLDELRVGGRDSAWKARLFVQTMEAALYTFRQMKSAPPEEPPPPLARVTWMVRDTVRRKAAATGLRQGLATAEGMALARNLANLPGNVCTPSYLAERARELGRSDGLKVTILDENKMDSLGMGALLSVSRGSREPARLIVMEYDGSRGAPRAARAAPVVLVGKGLTFDAGGISLKPAAAMDEMKYDMCGGAGVFGTLLAVARLKLPLRVVGIVPSSENLPDGAANKPGDVVTAMSGTTIEILNTDAEGRLILCDALTYAKRYKPALVIDIATLTGACVVALGTPASGLFSNDEQLARALSLSGEQSQDRVWRLPLWDDYHDMLKSPFADVANIGGRFAGAITAACFLERFAKEYRWAHLDIAGSAYRGGETKGASGRPVPLLTRFLCNYAEHKRKP